MSAYLKTLRLHVYLATIKESYFVNNKHPEANAKALHALKSTLNDDYLSRIFNFDSAFVVWYTLTFLKEQGSNNLKKEPIGDESDEAGYMVQGKDSLEVTSDTHLDDYSSSFNDYDSMDAHALNEELSMLCENLLSKYEVLKNKSFDLKKKNELLFLKLDLVL